MPHICGPHGKVVQAPLKGEQSSSKIGELLSILQSCTKVNGGRAPHGRTSTFICHRSRRFRLCIWAATEAFHQLEEHFTHASMKHTFHLFESNLVPKKELSPNSGAWKIIFTVFHTRAVLTSSQLDRRTVSIPPPPVSHLNIKSQKSEQDQHRSSGTERCRRLWTATKCLFLRVVVVVFVPFLFPFYSLSNFTP